MKRIVLILMIIPFIYASAQTNIPVIKGTVKFFADSVSETISLEKNTFLGGIYMASGRTDTLWFQSYNDVDALWYWIMENGSKYIIATDSSVRTYLSVEPTVFYPVKKLRILFKEDIADTLTLDYDKRPY